MVRTLFVLSMDFTFNEKMEKSFKDEFGVVPIVYLVPENKIWQVETCAYAAGRAIDFIHQEKDYEIVREAFERKLREKEIIFDYVGTINLTYEERQQEIYLSNDIPCVII